MKRTNSWFELNKQHC